MTPEPEATFPAGPSLLRLLQLASPALPIGAFAYSQGLEGAVAAGWVRDEADAARWILGLLSSSLGALDLPVLARVHAAWTAGDRAGAWRWSALLYASRASAELQAEERHLAWALARVLGGQGQGAHRVDEARLAERSPSREGPGTLRGFPSDDVEALAAEARGSAGAGLTYVAVFAVACCAWRIPAQAALGGFAFAWAEAQVGAALRLVPLGQTAGQRILSAAVAAIPGVVGAALAVTDDDVGAAAPAHGIASAWHETQYSRLFRS